MTFIEGIGDEVTAFFVIAIVVVLATLVTFIGSGPHLYSPVHTRTVHIAVLSRRQTIENTAVQSPDPPNTTPPLANNSSPPYESLTVDFQPPTTDNYNQQEPVSPTNDAVEDVTDDTDDPSSSDETRETDPPTETPTAPSEPDVAREAQETTQESSDAQGIRVRLKYLDDTERTVRSSPVTKVADFKRNHFPEDLANNKVVRLIFCGHLLRDNSTLQSYRVIDNSVLHVQVLQAQGHPDRGARSPSSGQQGAQELLDLSHLLWPLVTLILGLCWAFYIKYPEFFSVISISLLFVFTASFFVFYRHVHQ